MTRTTLVQANSTTLFMALELSRDSWFLAASDRNGIDVGKKKITASDWRAFDQFVAKMKARLGLPASAEVHTCHEAGRDGFWVHRALIARGIASIVLDPSSIQVTRRNRQAKTDRLDAEKLLALLLRLSRGEKAAKAVRVPTIQEEDERHQHRERQRVQATLTATTNQIRGLLTLHGLAHVDGRQLPLARLVELRTFEDKPLPCVLLARLQRALELRDTLVKQLQQLQSEIRAEIKARALAVEHDAQDDAVVRLQQLVSIGENGALVLGTELMWRDFKNRREVGAYTGLVGVPNLSGGGGTNGSISKAGNPRVRRIAIELAWLWLRHQAESALSIWFEERWGRGGKRNRRVGIVALARKLIIALWRFVKEGVVPEGARLKAT